MRAVLLAPILLRVMKEGESKQTALILMKNSHFDRTLQQYLNATLLSALSRILLKFFTTKCILRSKMDNALTFRSIFVAHYHYNHQRTIQSTGVYRVPQKKFESRVFQLRGLGMRRPRFPFFRSITLSMLLCKFGGNFRVRLKALSTQKSLQGSETKKEVLGRKNRRECRGIRKYFKN